MGILPRRYTESSLLNIARHIIHRAVEPRLLSHLSPVILCDVASNVHSALARVLEFAQSCKDMLEKLKTEGPG